MHTIQRSLVASLAMTCALQVAADTTTQAISGSQSAQENGCVDAIGIFTANDCSYNGINRWVSGPTTYNPPRDTLDEAAVTPPIQIEAFVTDRADRQWIGPLANQMYYETGSSPFSNDAFPAVGDNKAELGLSGQISIDDNNTADGADDVISGTIVIAAGTRNVLTGQGDNSRVEESWSSLTQTLERTAVDSATANASGGFDYVIASRGMPDRLQPMGLNNQAYPSEIASSPILDPAVSGWVAPDSQGRSVTNYECVPESPTLVTASWNTRRNRLRISSPLGADCADPESNNVGATTTGEFQDWVCVRADGSACPNNGAILGVAAGNPGFDNLLIALSTNAAGEIISSNAFYTHQYQVLQFLFGFSTPFEAWDGGELVMGGTGSVVIGQARARPSGGSPDVNLRSGGCVSVVLYSNDSLDATQVSNPTFGPTSTGLCHNNPHISDQNGDGVDDLVMHFRQRDIGLSCGDTSAILNAETGDGLPFSATVTVNTVGC